MSPSANIKTIESRISYPFTSIIYSLGRSLVLPAYFGTITVTGMEHFPQQGPVVLAPTHRSRWDGIMMGYAFGRPAIGRDPRFMVTVNEMHGFQGWFIRQFGGFPIDPDQPSIAALRHGIDLLRANQVLVIFPEGDVMRDRNVKYLKPGLARLAIQAQKKQKAGPDINILPVALDYGCPVPKKGCRINVKIGRPLNVVHYQGPAKVAASALSCDLKAALNHLIDGFAVTPDPEKVTSSLHP
ncbi:lysophospholipid acyltransferase family protein [Acaryochloris sp. IP29b_bin.148]|uniref:lysophospholipid acyltransferase family protein n=1 Tax=Acaryochloris sp. IP29b_bin.148 TaxID=2969218 RepID=UPI002630F93A|nr:lysophospholipid acyltransferase family protein [Acaryochloris sp. IP29b_bin.148]